PAAGFAKVPIAFDSKVLGTKKEELTAGRYVWNLGDFTIRESAAREKFTHLYDWPGEYVVVLDYYKDAQTKESDASDRLVIKVSAFSVEITNVGLPPDVFVELSNKSAKEVNLSSFILGQDGKFFYIPQNTIILANKKMIIPAKITGFAGVNPAALFFPTGERAFLWPPPQVITPVLPPPAKKPIATAVSNKIEEDPPQILKTPPETAEAEDLLEAGAAKSGFAFNKNWLWILGVAGLVVLGLAAIFLLKEDKDDEDFTLVE
ncbi:MAG TPA: hypothetical protein VJ103_02285, partial [Candidatus Paceibacterota bacterium]|nr:hypothetical protein [Candidatus Paceibacterota bacterium]